jgi:BASS family bile acid:Na+ symporter
MILPCARDDFGHDVTEVKDAALQTRHLSIMVATSTTVLWILFFLCIAPSTISFWPTDFLRHAHHHHSVKFNYDILKPAHARRSTITSTNVRRQDAQYYVTVKKSRLLQERIAQDAESVAGSRVNRLDKVLFQLTSLFPFFVMSAACLATYQPTTLNWVNKGNTITLMLAAVMIGMGMTLSKKDFDLVFQSTQIKTIPLGVLCQFGIMPLSSFLVGKYIMKLNRFNPSLFLGLVLVGSSPGGTASNLVSLIANADVALSVVLTSCSTMLASLVTPLFVKLLSVAGATGSTAVVSISGWALCAATAKVVLAPILFGMTLNSKVPKLCQWISRFTPFASVLLVSLICGGVVAQNASTVMMTAMGGSRSVLKDALLSVFLLHAIGFLAGYIIPRHVLKCDERTSRTVSIETGMQNSALACVLARSISDDPMMSLPGALSATMHSCLGSMLAAYWRTNDNSLKE